MRGLKAGVLGMTMVIVTVITSEAANWQVTRPRVPADQLETIRAMKNPLSPTPENLAKGREVYEGRGLCATCHGLNGKGDGEAGKLLDPKPTDFTDPEFHKNRTDGELFWVTKHGVPDTGMIGKIPLFISEEEAWAIILYIRTLERKE